MAQLYKADLPSFSSAVWVLQLSALVAACGSAVCGAIVKLIKHAARYAVATLKSRSVGWRLGFEHDRMAGIASHSDLTRHADARVTYNQAVKQPLKRETSS